MCVPCVRNISTTSFGVIISIFHLLNVYLHNSIGKKIIGKLTNGPGKELTGI
jgi:hypothetical protein